MLYKLAKVSRGVSRGTSLKGKIVHMINVSMGFTSDLSDRVNVCSVARKHVKSNVTIVFQVNSSLILSQVVICRLQVEGNNSV